MSEQTADLVKLTFASAVTGALVGLIGGSFRYCLAMADRLREILLVQAHLAPVYGLCATLLAVGFAAAFSRWLVVRFAPIAAGSGVQRVEAVMRGEAQPAGPEVIPVKFLGGLAAIGSGLVLGREGPTVQMGAAVGTVLSNRVLADAPDQTIINAAGAGAGLAVAFNAPIGGAIFVFEELARSFTPRLAIATVGATAVATAVTRWMLGDTLDFDAGVPAHQPVWQLPFYIVLGGLMGCAGAAYNALTLRCLLIVDRLADLPSIVRAAAIGLAVGGVAWIAPVLIGGGDSLVQNVISAPMAPISLALIFAARFVIGPVCYAAGTPGGLFAPLLALGATSGALIAYMADQWLPGVEFSAVSGAVVGMAALFTAVVRAPLTGMVLTIEMTARSDLALAMLFGCVSAGFFVRVMGSEPIYDILRNRMLRASQ